MPSVAENFVLRGKWVTCLKSLTWLAANISFSKLKLDENHDIILIVDVYAKDKMQIYQIFNGKYLVKMFL